MDVDGKDTKGIKIFKKNPINMSMKEQRRAQKLFIMSMDYDFVNDTLKEWGYSNEHCSDQQIQFEERRKYEFFRNYSKLLLDEEYSDIVKSFMNHYGYSHEFMKHMEKRYIEKENE